VEKEELEEIKRFLSEQEHPLAPGEPLIEKIKNLCNTIHLQQKIVKDRVTALTELTCAITGRLDCERSKQMWCEDCTDFRCEINARFYRALDCARMLVYPLPEGC